MKNFKGSFKETERITKNICEHTFVLKNMSIHVCISAKKRLSPAIIEHFQQWNTSSLSDKGREELYAVYQIEGRGKKVIKLNNKYKLVIEATGTGSTIENTEYLINFYKSLLTE